MKKPLIYRNQKQLSRFQTKTVWMLIGFFQLLTENTWGWNFARRMLPRWSGWKGSSHAPCQPKPSYTFCSSPSCTSVCDIRQTSGADMRRRKHWPQILQESDKINEAASKLERDGTTTICLVLPAVSRSHCGGWWFSTWRPSKTHWRASAAHSPWSRGPNRFWGFVSCQIQDSAKEIKNKHTRPP